jgi:hypothetical protein
VHADDMALLVEDVSAVVHEHKRNDYTGRRAAEVKSGDCDCDGAARASGQLAGATEAALLFGLGPRLLTALALEHANCFRFAGLAFSTRRGAFCHTRGRASPG